MKLRFTTFAIVSLLGLGSHTLARFIQPSLMPTERLLKRVYGHLKINPDDARAHYTLGRIHYLAFYNRSSTAAAYGQPEDEDLPRIAPYWTAEQRFLYHARSNEAMARMLKKFDVKSLPEIPQDEVSEFYKQMSALTVELEEKDWKPEHQKPGVAGEHATLALKAFDKAINLDPKSPLYLLGKASLLEQSKTFYSIEKPKRVDPILSKVTTEQIRDGYYRAFATGVEPALKLESRPESGLRSIASYEAGTAYTRLCEGDRNELTELEETRLAEVKEALGKLNKLRIGAITPIVFSLRKNARLAELLEPTARVDFDLDGDGITEKCPWVRGDTAFLVWDPARCGRILSGRQLFGSYTWQIPFGNGYEPLAMLDQGGDGQLTGTELEGIRAWFDRNGDGVSNVGEVVDLGILQIESIATDGVFRQETHDYSSDEGIRLNSGETFPTWDWLPMK